MAKKINKVIKNMDWKLPDPTLHECPYSNVTLYVSNDLNNQIFEVYRYGQENGIEISIYAKIIKDEIVELYIPEQENTVASVEYKEQVPLEWNCLIHSHPNNITSFSYQDEQTLFGNRECCLLICNNKYTDGIIKVSTECGCMLYAKAYVEVEKNTLLNKISKKIFKVKNIPIKDNEYIVDEVKDDWSVYNEYLDVGLQ